MASDYFNELERRRRAGTQNQSSMQDYMNAIGGQQPQKPAVAPTDFPTYSQGVGRDVASLYEKTQTMPSRVAPITSLANPAADAEYERLRRTGFGTEAFAQAHRERSQRQRMERDLYSAPGRLDTSGQARRAAAMEALRNVRSRAGQEEWGRVLQGREAIGQLGAGYQAAGVAASAQPTAQAAEKVAELESTRAASERASKERLGLAQLQVQREELASLDRRAREATTAQERATYAQQAAALKESHLRAVGDILAADLPIEEKAAAAEYQAALYKSIASGMPIAAGTQQGQQVIRPDRSQEQLIIPIPSLSGQEDTTQALPSVPTAQRPLTPEAPRNIGIKNMQEADINGDGLLSRDERNLALVRTMVESKRDLTKQGGGRALDENNPSDLYRLNRFKIIADTLERRIRKGTTA